MGTTGPSTSCHSFPRIFDGLFETFRNGAILSYKNGSNVGTRRAIPEIRNWTFCDSLAAALHSGFSLHTDQQRGLARAGGKLDENLS